ncbi:MAG: tRNA (adenosine(37)-N6)-threonylcarbamoyltransferase complex ATPase subunit type 1 TsaE [Candidatus Paceibacterota bacterium]|jgi:tRNA threonylcarbamoyl adenosine modification protein YjeE
MEKMIKTLTELEVEAACFVAELSPQEGGATLVTLSGDLGAGKTAFTKAVARVLGVEETITSPTFVLEKIYQLSPKYGSTKPIFKRLVHIDAYRLEVGSDLAPLGFDELMQDAGNLILLEWPEKVLDALPTPTVRLSLSILPDDSRMITYG